MTIASPPPAALTALEAEESVLGALVLNLELLPRVRTILPDIGAFSAPAHRALYGALLALAERVRAADPVMVRSTLAERGESELVSDQWIAELCDQVTHTGSIEAHAVLVRDRWQRRQLITAAESMGVLARDPRQRVEDVIATAVDRVVSVQTATLRPVVTMQAGMWELLEELEQCSTIGDIVGVPTRLGALDRLTHGWQRGQLIIVGARPSVGKTSLAVDCALEAADIGPVYFATAEMPARKIRRRMLARAARQDLWQLAHPEFYRMAHRDLEAAAGELGALPIRIDDTVTTVGAIRMGAQRWGIDAGGLTLVVVDYLQLFSSGRRAENRNIEVGQMTRALARLAIDLDVPVLCCAQLSRAPDKDVKVRRPRLSDLRDSGNIEQDADVVALLHVPAADPPDPYDRQLVTTEILLEKNRDGECGIVTVHHQRATGQWMGVSVRGVPTPPSPRAAPAQLGLEPSPGGAA